MSGPYCTHLMVSYAPIDHSDGTRSDSWHCRDCKTEFAALAAKDAEIERLKKILHDADATPLSEWATEMAARKENAAALALLVQEKDAELAQVRQQVEALKAERDAWKETVRSTTETEGTHVSVWRQRAHQAEQRATTAEAERDRARAEVLDISKNMARRHERLQAAEAALSAAREERATLEQALNEGRDDWRKLFLLAVAERPGDVRKMADRNITAIDKALAALSAAPAPATPDEMDEDDLPPLPSGVGRLLKATPIRKYPNSEPAVKADAILVPRECRHMNRRNDWDPCDDCGEKA